MPPSRAAPWPACCRTWTASRPSTSAPPSRCTGGGCRPKPTTRALQVCECLRKLRPSGSVWVHTLPFGLHIRLSSPPEGADHKYLLAEVSAGVDHALHLTLFLFYVTVDFRRSNTMPSQRHSPLHRSALPSQWRKSMAAKGMCTHCVWNCSAIWPLPTPLNRCCLCMMCETQRLGCGPACRPRRP